MSLGFIDKILSKMIDCDASDAYITVGKPPIYRTINEFIEHDDQNLIKEDIIFIANRLLTEIQQDEFRKTLDYNISINWENKSRFRINLFYQQLNPGMVIRRIKTEIPSIESLGLPVIYGKIMEAKKGLILISSPSGTGKSTSVAAMLDHKNKNDSLHILTIEDPIEYKHQNIKSIFTQREIGTDTLSYHSALKNALRQRADIVFIGEIRDLDSMEHALTFAETGHLCISTLHSNNAHQALLRIIHMYPDDIHKKILLNLSNCLNAIISQKLVTNNNNNKSLAFESLINTGIIKDLIAEARFNELYEHMEKNENLGMRTFNSSLYELYINNIITKDEAISNSDNQSALRLKILKTTDILKK